MDQKDVQELTEAVIRELKEDHYIIPKYAVKVLSASIVIAGLAIGISGWASLRDAAFNTAKATAETKAASVAEKKAEDVATQTARRVAGNIADQLTQEVLGDAKARARQSVELVFSEAIGAATAVANETVKSKVTLEAQAAAQTAADAAASRTISSYLNEKGVETSVIEKLKKSVADADALVDSIRTKDREIQALGVEKIVQRLGAIENSAVAARNDLETVTRNAAARDRDYEAKLKRLLENDRLTRSAFVMIRDSSEKNGTTANVASGHWQYDIRDRLPGIYKQIATD